MKKYVACLLLILSVGLRGTETSAQRMSIICSNSTGAALDVTIVLKSPDGKSSSFRCDELECKTFDCDLKEAGKYSLTVIFKERGAGKPVIPFGTCIFTVTGAESSVKAAASCALAEMVIPCESLNMSAPASSDAVGKSREYSNRRHGSLHVRKFYPRSAADRMNVSDNFSEKTSAWDISVISIAE